MPDQEAQMYDVQFKYTVEESAHVYAAAFDPETAKAAALDILKQQGGQYANAEIVSVKLVEHTPSPTLN